MYIVHKYTFKYINVYLYKIMCCLCSLFNSLFLSCFDSLTDCHSAWLYLYVQSCLPVIWHVRGVLNDRLHLEVFSLSRGNLSDPRLSVGMCSCAHGKHGKGFPRTGTHSRSCNLVWILSFDSKREIMMIYLCVFVNLCCLWLCMIKAVFIFGPFCWSKLGCDYSDLLLPPLVSFHIKGFGCGLWSVLWHQHVSNIAAFIYQCR